MEEVSFWVEEYIARFKSFTMYKPDTELKIIFHKEKPIKEWHFRERYNARLKEIRTAFTIDDSDQTVQFVYYLPKQYINSNMEYLEKHDYYNALKGWFFENKEITVSSEWVAWNPWDESYEGTGSIRVAFKRKIHKPNGEMKDFPVLIFSTECNTFFIRLLDKVVYDVR